MSSKQNTDSSPDKIRDFIDKIKNTPEGEKPQDNIVEYLTEKLPSFSSISEYYTLDFHYFQENIVRNAIFTCEEAITFLENTEKNCQYDNDTRQSASFKMLPYITLKDSTPEKIVQILTHVTNIEILENLKNLPLGDADQSVDFDADFEIEKRDEKIKRLQSEIKCSVAKDNDLYAAARLGKVEELKKILQVDPEATTKPNLCGWTALHLATFNRRYEAMKYLLGKGADANAVTKKLMHGVPNQYGRNLTPLHLAAINCDIEAIKILKKNNGNVFITDENDQTPRDYVKGNNELEKILENNSSNDE